MQDSKIYRDDNDAEELEGVQLPKVTRGQKILFGLVAICQFIMNGVISGAMLKFYTNFIDPNGKGGVYGWAFLLFGIWNAVNDPIFGFMSDRKEPDPKKGKRLPYIRRGLPIMLVGFFILVFLPPKAPEIFLFILLLVGFFIFDFGMAMWATAFTALRVTITNDVNERATISLYISYITLVPGALAGILPTVFFTGAFTYFDILLFLVLLGGGSFALSYVASLKLKEPYEIYLQEKKVGRERHLEEDDEAVLSLGAALKEVLKSKPFRIFAVYSFMAAAVVGSYYSQIVFLIDDVFMLDEIPALLVTGIGGLTINLYYPLVKKMYVKWDGVKTITLSSLASIAGFLMIFFTDNFWVLFFGYAIITVGYSGYWMTSSLIIGDISDEYFLEHGIRRQSTFSSMLTFITTPAVSVISFIFTQIIDAFGYNGQLEVQSPTAMLGIRIGVAIIPMLFLVTGLVILQFFPIKGARFKQLRKQMEALGRLE